ncbi:SirB2 family protein [Rhodoferax sp. BAB1]|uniref:SirB2 family protein n=1 Tax=Rhodoferax sp. BAB1 TaxID=2741720 RepID=UPI001575E609|nr:SirB2 family protein [Rhodoferax sp. BAB1]QKO22281.1 SirB2 family protein [Rhodoferax sp. BAB1]
MDWIVHYPALRHLHMGLAFTSGALFALRGAAVLTRQRWPLHPVLGRVSAIIDTGLLAAALRLLWELRLNPLLTPWLQVKLAVLPLYIVLGMLALKYARRREAKALCYIGALACYGFMVSVALTHSPWGLFASWDD